MIIFLLCCEQKVSDNFIPFISKALWVYFQNVGESRLVRWEVHLKPRP